MPPNRRWVWTTLFWRADENNPWWSHVQGWRWNPFYEEAGEGPQQEPLQQPEQQPQQPQPEPTVDVRPEDVPIPTSPREDGEESDL
jgi:hypothetical protein